MSWLTELEELERAATPGPWSKDDCNIFCQPLADARHAAIVAKIEGRPFDQDAIKLDAFVATTGQRHEQSDADADLIAALRNAAQRLIAIAQTHSALLDELNAALAYKRETGMRVARPPRLSALSEPQLQYLIDSLTPATRGGEESR